MPLLKWNIEMSLLLCTIAVANAQSTQPPSVDPGRWAYPQQAVFDSDPALIGDYVPCLFDLDEQGNFRAIRNPSSESQMKNAAIDAVHSSSLLKPDQQLSVISDISKWLLTTQTPSSTYQSANKSVTRALANDPTLTPENKDAIATSVANNITAAAQQAGPIRRPPDVSCGMSVLPWNVVRWSFGREIAENFIVVQVTVRNLNNEQQFLVHDVELAVDTQPGIFNRFSSSTDQSTVDGVALTAEEGGSSRAFWLRLANFVGSIVSAASVPIPNGTLKDAAGVYGGAFIPAIDKLFKDHSSEQIARLDSSVFTNSQSRKVIVSKNDSATFDTFLPAQSLLQIDWGRIYQYKTGALGIDAGAKFTLDRKSNYKDWSPLALQGFNNSTFVIVAGAHITESPTQATVTAVSCPPNSDSVIDLAKATGDSVSCTVKGTNLNIIAQLILENAQDTNDHTYAIGTVSIAAADTSQATVQWNVKDLQVLKTGSYKLFYATKGGTPQATNLTMTVQQVVSILPSSLTFASQPLTDSTSPAQSVTVTNRTTTPLTVSKITITGSNATDFSEKDLCTGTPVAAGANCVISVTFKPTAAGSRAANINIADSGPGNPHTVALSGTGTAAPAPAVGLNPTSLTFSGQPVGTSSSSQNVTLTNSGTGPLTVSKITISGANATDFSEKDMCTGGPVAVGANCVISVTFKPTAAGSRMASINIADNGPGNPHAVAMSGTGALPQ